MIGVFDSGAGGLSAAYELRRLLPRANIVFLGDEKNAPYGTKTKEELLPLIRADIRRLAEMGAERILIACCTASTLWCELDPQEQKVTLPIIDITAESVGNRAERVLVIATEYTASSGAFSRAVKKIYPRISVREIAMQSLVGKIEMHKSRPTERSLADLIAPELDFLGHEIKENMADGLVLGCTDFSWIEQIIKERWPSLEVINPVRLGAAKLVRELSLFGINVSEGGRVIATR